MSSGISQAAHMVGGPVWGIAVDALQMYFSMNRYLKLKSEQKKIEVYLSEIAI
jgi:hypothetical protein